MAAATVLAALVLAGSAVAEPVTCRDSAYLTWRPSDGEGHRLSVVDIDTGELSDVAELPFRINAIGYHEPGDRMYGLARPDPTRWERASAPHLVAIDPAGEVEDHGALQGLTEPVPGLAGAYAGAVHDGQLVVLGSHELVFVDLTDSRGQVTQRTRLTESADTLNIGDFDSDGRQLYGVDTKAQSIVRIDPETGTVARTPVDGLPDRSLAGAAFITPDHRLHTVLNGIAGQAVLYRMDPTADNPEAVEYGRLPAVSSADAAACRASEPQPSDPPAEPPPSDPTTSDPTTSDPTASEFPTPSEPPTSSESPSGSPPPPSSESPSPTPGSTNPDPSPPSAAPPAASPPVADPPDLDSPSIDPPGGSPAAASEPPAVAEPPAGQSPAAFPDQGHVAVGHEDDDPPRRWIAVSVVILAMVGAAGVKATAKRPRR